MIDTKENMINPILIKSVRQTKIGRLLKAILFWDWTLAVHLCYEHSGCQKGPKLWGNGVLYTYIFSQHDRWMDIWIS